MVKHLSRVLSIALCAALVLPSSAWAWGDTGHEAVAYVAWQQLTPATKARVIALLKQVPTLSPSIPGFKEWDQSLPAGGTEDQRNQYLFMIAATWPDSIKHHGLQDSDVPPAGLTEEVHVGFTDKQSHGYWHFVDTAFSSDGSQVPPTPSPSAVTQIAALRTFLASDEDDTLKAYDLVWLEHLVGDVHQPLHAVTRIVAGASDEGGNKVKVKLSRPLEADFACSEPSADGKPEPPSKTAPRELHAFWDDLPGTCRSESALTHAEAYGKSLSSADEDKVADTDPADWASESLTFAKKDVYVSPIGAGNSQAVITTAYYNRASADARAQVALAGARLAKLLNDSLQ